VPSGGELYHLQFSFQAASLETFGYTLVCTQHKGLVVKMMEFEEETVYVLICANFWKLIKYLKQQDD
jgi:hypothetical protein